MVQTISSPTKVFQRTFTELKGLGFDVELNQNKSICIRKGIYPVATVVGELANIFDLNYTATTQCLDNTERMLLADLTYKLSCIEPQSRKLVKSVDTYALYLPDELFKTRYYVIKTPGRLAVVAEHCFNPENLNHLFTEEEMDAYEMTFASFNMDYHGQMEVQI